MQIKKLFSESIKLKDEEKVQFRHYFITENLNRMKSMGVLFIFVLIFYEILLLINFLPNNNIPHYVLLSVLALLIVGQVLIRTISKSKSWKLKQLLTEVTYYTLLVLAIIYTYMMFRNNTPDFALFFVVLFILDMAMLDSPYKTVPKIIGSYVILIILLYTTSKSYFGYSHLFTSMAFIIMCVFSCIASFNNQKVLYIEKTEHKNASERDQLTGLNNRRKIDEVLSMHTKEWQPISILMIDIDFFKKINDTYGHQQGDDVLVQLGQVIKGHLRTSDIAGRWGGEEFVIICNATNSKQARMLAERLRVKISSHDFGNNIRVNVSIGVCEMQDKDTIVQIIGLADKALYYAKENGRNRIDWIDRTTDEVTK
ncbi:MAG: GGDEF domain-containing protein [Clostridiales bacterium]|nr:GGDEF domain-containing protein [Clostridiales bacterium]